jgi:hypothetical protein
MLTVMSKNYLPIIIAVVLFNIITAYLSTAIAIGKIGNSEIWRIILAIAGTLIVILTSIFFIFNIMKKKS